LGGCTVDLATRNLNIPTYSEYHSVFAKTYFYFIVALSCWPCTFDEFYWRSPIAMRSVPAPKSGLRTSADGRPTPGSPARPGLRLPTCCPPPSAPRRRRAPLARGCVCPPVAPRRRPRAGAALSSPAAAAARLLPAAVGAAPAPRSPRPRLRLPACCPPPSPPRWRRAPFACEFCGAEGRGLATLPTRRGVWGRGRRALAGTGWCWTLRRARRWADGGAAAQSGDAARLRVVRRWLLAAGGGRLCAPRKA